MRHEDLRRFMRVRTLRAIPRFPDYIVPRGLTGTITMLGEREVWVKFDRPVAGAEEWQNHAYWSDDIGEIGFEERRPDVLAKQLKVFFEDVEVIDDGKD